MSQGVEEALNNEVSVVMTTEKSRHESYNQDGKEIVDKSLTVWSALSNAVEIYSLISTIVMRAKSPSDA